MQSSYRVEKVLGEGTWGLVYEAFRKNDNTKVAIKRSKGIISNIGQDFSFLREIKYLQESKSCIHIVNILDVYIVNSSINLVLEYCDFDLEKVIKDKNILLHASHIKCYMQMLLQGLQFLHSKFILHRDLKPANLLLNDRGILKIADFGAARTFGSPNVMSKQVITRFYRPPELLFGAVYYGDRVDVWSAGCILCDLVLREPIFASSENDSDVGQLARIFNIMGTPTEQIWPNVTLLPNYIEFESREPLNLATLFPNYDENCESNKISSLLQLVSEMLMLDPLKRLSATQCLEHRFFTTTPPPCPTETLPKPVPKNNNPSKKIKL